MGENLWIKDTQSSITRKFGMSEIWNATVVNGISM